MMRVESGLKLMTLQARWLRQLPRKLHWRVADFILFMMVLGPLIAPYFSRIELPLYQNTARLVFAIGHFICPQPQYAFDYAGLPFAVCYRCTAAFFGLIVSRWLQRPGGAMRNWSLMGRLVFLSAALLWLVIELDYTQRGIWLASIPLMLVHGVIYGLSVGGVVFSVLVLFDRSRESVSRPMLLVTSTENAVHDNALNIMSANSAQSVR